ncbi:MAG: hypothetical protein J6Y25_01555 [Elusimicrobiaceae bacterium]|nr:hypothetical protein [Elusimicrobiaceae bacterium]
MKSCACFLLIAVMALPAAAYQAGPQGRPNFGSNQQQPAQPANARAFTNYSNRGWNQGVQTQGVETSVAGETVIDFTKKPETPSVSKKAAAEPKPAKPAVAPKPSTQQTPAAMPANADPAAMMQQVQGMMQMMNQAGGQPAGGNPAGMPAIPGMPDLSNLMGGAAAPAAAPAKK